MRIIMLAPVFLGLLFFTYCAISGFLAVQTTKLPADFKDVKLKISNYEIKQLGSKDSKSSWTLKSSKAYASSDESKATIIDPRLTFFESGREKFRIASDLAYLNKLAQEVLLINGVTLKTADGKYNLNSGSLKFAEDKPFLDLKKDWTLASNDGSTISGNTGLVNKSFDSITSIGNASLTKKDGDKSIVIRAEKIELNSNAEIPITATSSAVLDIDQNQKLYASLIRIKKNGGVLANSSVRVVTKKMICQSNNLEIIPNENKNPKTAIFKGNPHITQNNHTIYADLITYDFATEAATITGNVHSGN